MDNIGFRWEEGACLLISCGSGSGMLHFCALKSFENIGSRQVGDDVLSRQCIPVSSASLGTESAVVNVNANTN